MTVLSKLPQVLAFCTLSILWFTSNGAAQSGVKERQIKVAMRMIGDQVLLHIGDSSSRILPIQKQDNRYQVPFENEFEFMPDTLVEIIAQIVAQSNITNGYLVEVEHCETHEVVYSYQIGGEIKEELVPCRQRVQPEDCYVIYFTILADNRSLVPWSVLPGLSSEEHVSVPNTSYSFYSLLIIPLLALGGLLRYKSRHKVNPDLITIGKYLFDKRSMELILEKNVVELSSKESDLLSLLHATANTTIERQVILKSVWEDEGDYVGRTLDVFISKLRKKLEADPRVKIMNTRGIGYKLVIKD